jgi:hypothetical protein
MDLGQGSAMALPIVAWFWHKVANDRKLGRMLQEKFPQAPPEVLGLLGCYPWIGIKPDSFNLLMQDSVFRDSVQSASRKSGPDAKTPGGEVEAADPPEDSKEKGGKEDKKNIFQRLFNKRDEEKKKEN